MSADHLASWPVAVLALAPREETGNSFLGRRTADDAWQVPAFDRHRLNGVRALGNGAAAANRLEGFGAEASHREPVRSACAMTPATSSPTRFNSPLVHGLGRAHSAAGQHQLNKDPRTQSFCVAENGLEAARLTAVPELVQQLG
jgi:hypothetical protein